MIEPENPCDEVERLKELLGLCILNTAPEEKFDRITRIAQRYFCVEIALVSLIDNERQWFKSKQGLEATETARNISFCGHAILQNGVFLIEDAALDLRFADNPLVIGAPFIRFYAGMPLHGPNGYRVGTLCIIDSKPRQMSNDDVDTLKELGVLIETIFGAAKLSQLTLNAKKNEAKLAAILDHIVDGIITVDETGHIDSINNAGAGIFGYSEVELLNKNINMLMPEPFQSEHDQYLRNYLGSKNAKIIGNGREVVGLRKDGTTFSMELAVSEMWTGNKKSFVGIVRDISIRTATMNALVSSEKRWQFAIEGAGDGVWDWDVQTNTVKYSKRWKEMLGFQDGEIGNSVEEWSSRVHPEDMPHLMEGLQLHLDGKTPFFSDEHRFKCKDGSWLWIHDRGLVVSRDSLGNPLNVIGTHTDITDRKQSEIVVKDALLELSKTKEALQTTIDNIPALIGYWDCDLSNRFANSAYTAWFGVTPQKMVGQHISEIIGQSQYDQIKSKLQSVLQGNVEIFERTIFGPSKVPRHVIFSYIPDIEDGSVKGCYGFVSDITPLKEAQLGQSKALAQLQSTFDAASEFSIITTDINGLIKVFSAGSEKMLGYSSSDVVDKKNLDFFHLNEEVATRISELRLELGRSVCGFNAIVEHARRGGAESREWTYVRKDGAHFPIQLTVTSITDADKVITGFLGIAKDISKEKIASAELRQAIVTAESANRAKSEFVANMSHEIRTPMNAVLGMTYLLSTTELSNEQKKYVSMIQVSGKSLLGILNDILDFSKIEAGKMELSPTMFQMDDVVSAVASLMAVYAADKELELAIGIDANVPRTLFGDALRIQQILINLVGNAVKFTKKGEVSVLIEEVHRTKALSSLRFSVRDTGIGMTDEQQSRLFSAFSQADASTTRRFGGSGLGLTISKKLVEMMNGNLGVHSTPNIGSEFYFELPLEWEAQSDSEQIEQESMRNLRILVVDDNLTSRELLRKTIHSWQWHVECADSGEQAIALISQKNTLAERFDVILIDWEMPGMDGLATMDAIRATFSTLSIPVVMMVGAYSRVKLMQTEAVARADAILQKPVTSSDLFNTISEAQNIRRNGAHISPFASRQKEHYRLDGVNILLVEDNLLNQLVAKGMLEKAGAKLTIEENGQKAVDVLRVNATQFDLILMDVQMPVMDGFTATRLIRDELNLSIPIIAMTAGVMESEKAECTAVGMNDFISKPIEVDQLFSVILRHAPKEGARRTFDPIPRFESASVDTGNEASEFNIDRLIAVSSNNPKSYDVLMGVVRNLIDRSSEQMEQVKNHWDNGRLDEAARQLHTMRGTIGTLGGKQFAQRSSELEAAILHGDTIQVPTLMANAQCALDLVITQARRWFDQQDNSTHSEQFHDTAELNPLDLGLLAQFRHQLVQQNIKACDTYKNIRLMIKSRVSTSALEELDHAIDQLDFINAAKFIRHLS
jgi:two-component system sensor histidine kinase/response regulator